MTLTPSCHVLLIASGLLAYSATAQAQVANAARVHEAFGKEVRVTHVDGTRTTGILVALSTADVVLRRNDRERRVELVNVDRVERVGHPRRNAALWAAAVAGGTAAALIPVLEHDGPGDAAGFIVGWVGLAGAAGAGIGAAIGLANRDDNVLYLSSRAPSIVLAPAVSAGGAGIALSIKW